jgi:hypothetical protein
MPEAWFVDWPPHRASSRPVDRVVVVGHHLASFFAHPSTIAAAPSGHGPRTITLH